MAGQSRSHGRWSGALRVVKQPVADYLDALDACLRPFRAGCLALAVSAFGLSWWVYVPIHELLHAAGCVLGGGEVTRLEIHPLYGGAFLERLFPFVAVGSDYAGQLTGFDTHGNDVTYLLTDFLPFALTILFGVPLLRSAAKKGGRPSRAAVCLGFALPIAYAPFISLGGDYYEMGSILVTRAVAWWQPNFALERWRSDDLFKLVRELQHSATPLSPTDAAGLAGGLAVGVALAFATYAAGSWCANDSLPNRG